MAKHWSLMQVWNDSFKDMPKDEIKPRGYLYATDLGSSQIECFYKLQGLPYTNHFTLANYRKMEAGKMYEAICRYVLKKCGILKKSQLQVDHQLPGLLEVHGRLDFVSGGKVDLQQIKDTAMATKILFEDFEFPKTYQKMADLMLAYVESLTAKDLLYVYVMEIKSVSDFVYRLYERSNRALNSHHLQCFHYLLGSSYKIAKANYINRDNVLLMEKVVLKDKVTLKEYTQWVESMTDHVISNTVPPIEPLILWHEDNCTFAKNTTGVEWCKYLTKIYGYEDAQGFRDHITPMVKSFNYVYDRCVKNKLLTDDNKKMIITAKTFFPDWDNLVDQGKLRAVLQEGKQEEVSDEA